MSPALVKGPHLTEAEFQVEVLRWAKQLGWLGHAERPARTATGWRTPIQGDAGFCDLVLVKPPRLIFAELKVGKNKVTPEQRVWMDALEACEVEAYGMPASSCEVYEWRPENWDGILKVLSGRN